MNYEVEELYEGLEKKQNGDGKEYLEIDETRDKLMRESHFN